MLGSPPDPAAAQPLPEEDDEHLDGQARRRCRRIRGRCQRVRRGCDRGDVRREFWGKDAIRGWVHAEVVGVHVTAEPTQVIEHHEQTILRGRYDGEYDKTNLPDELILTHYFTVRDGRIVTLIIIQND